MTNAFEPFHSPRLPRPREKRHRRWRWAIVALAGIVTLYLLAKLAAILAIEGYQRYLSPYKGFHCAHGKLHGGLTCSAFGKKAIAENGVILLAFEPHL